MTDAEAQARAKELYGLDAWTEITGDGCHDIVVGEDPATWQGWPPQILLGWGDTWEEAFELAAVRVAWEQLPQPEPRQLDLFGSKS